MSLLFIDGFDHYTNLDDKWDGAFFGGNIKPIQGAGRFGGAALQIKGSGGGGNRTKNLPLSDELICGFAYLATTDHSFSVFFGTTDDSTIFQCLLDPVAGTIEMRYDGGGGGNTVITAPSLITEDTWFWIEFRGKAHASLGEMEIRINNSTVASLTNIDTSLAADMLVLQVTTGSNNQLTYIDSLYVLDTTGSSNNNFLGDLRVATLYPKANGIVNNFAPSTPATLNYTMTNETLHDDDTTYVESGIVGARESYDNQNFSDIGVSPGTIFGVQVVNSSKKTDAAELRYRDQMVIAGVPFDDGVDVTATATIYKMTTYIRDTDPSDDATWTESKVADVGSGIEIKFRQV